MERASKRNVTLIESETANANKMTDKNYTQRKFIQRNSILTELYNENNVTIRTIYNVFIVCSIIILANTVLYEYISTGTFDDITSIITMGFANFHLALIIWLLIFGCVLLTYPVMILWANVVVQLQGRPRTFWNSSWITLVVIYYFALYTLVSVLMSRYQFGVATALALTFDHVRLTMKMQSFIRVNAEQVLNYKPHSGINWSRSTFQQFFYFLWAPTLIYKDSYPRTKEIDWRFIGNYSLKLVATIVYTAVIIEWIVRRAMHDFGERIYTVNDILLVFIRNTISGFFIHNLVQFYAIAQITQNAFAELLRFADRHFYGEWWAVEDFQLYFRVEGLYIQHWLYNYVYRDVMYVCQRIGVRRAKSLARIAVFLLSAIVHEWFMSCSLGFFYPVMFVEFLMFPPILNAIGVRSNLVFWLLLSFGGGTLISLYGMEYYVRHKHQIGVVNATALLPSFTPIMFDEKFFAFY